MNKLINDSEVFQKERPTKITEKQKIKVFTEVAESILEWNLSKDSIETIVSDLYQLNLNDTGFEMAKDLEDGWDMVGSYEIDSNFVEILESITSLINDENTKNVKEWVKAHSVKPNFKIGDEFTLKIAPFFSFSVGDKVYITMINSEKAYYCINKDKNGNGGTVVPFEKLERCI